MWLLNKTAHVQSLDQNKNENYIERIFCQHFNEETSKNMVTPMQNMANSKQNMANAIQNMAKFPSRLK